MLPEEMMGWVLSSQIQDVGVPPPVPQDMTAFEPRIFTKITKVKWSHMQGP